MFLNKLKYSLLPIRSYFIAFIYGFSIFYFFTVTQALSAQLPNLEVRGLQNDKFSRIVFDWGQDISYKSKRSDGLIDITFEAKATKIDMSKLNTAKLKSVIAVKHIKLPKSNNTYVRIALDKGTKHRGYKLGNRVIFDIYPASVFKKNSNKYVRNHNSSKKALAKIVDLNIKPKNKPVRQTAVVNTVTEIKKEAITNIVSNKNSNIETEEQVASKVSESRKTSDEVQKEHLATGYTTIIISTIEPVSLAVFERFGYLWIVADTDFATIKPEVAGAFASVLGEPKKVAVKGGRAYRFIMPKQAGIANVEFINLSWIISLKPASNMLTENISGQLRRIVRPKQKSEAEIFLPKANKVLELFDDDVGEKLYVVTSSASNSRVSLGVRYPEFAVLKAYQGAVVKTFSEHISLRKEGSNIIITAPNGLIMTRNLVTVPRVENVTGNEKNAEEFSKLFDFYNWRRGGLDYLWQNERKIEEKLLNASKGKESASVYLELALLYFANGYGHEAIGALRAAAMENPELSKNTGFLAIKGGAEALAGFPILAIKDLTTNNLSDHPEAKMWVGYAAAMSEQWKLAAENFPSSNKIVMSYPPNIAIPFILYMAESALRVGDTVKARLLLGTLAGMRKDMLAGQKAAEQYLLGEAYRQEGNYVQSLKLWYPVVNGKDRLFHVKASIATVNLLRELHRISDEEAQDRLETLRYLWRGDGLEIQMLHNIARLYLERQQYVRGLEEMREAVVLSEELLIDSSSLVADMEKIFSGLFVKGKADEMEPFRAVAIYNSFKELKPVGYDSYIAEQNYADYLVEMDLLDDAAKIFEKQLKYDWKDRGKISEIGLKLASIYLLDGKAKDAISVLQRTGGNKLRSDIEEKRELLRARALSRIAMIKEAINSLKGIDTVEAKRLKADIYWQNKEWEKAAEILENLLPTVEDIKLSPDNSNNELVLNTAVAYKLAGNKNKLNELRNKYMEAMKATKYGASFAVITRKDDANIVIPNKQNIMNMAMEVDLFKDFLKDYQSAKIY